ncbi:MAG: DUF4202 domain-containing protein [Myxococcales bacterium]|nr:DUF4202 domain-containing protein [Myxococcales bacterium]
MSDQRFRRAIERFDELNAADPRPEPREWRYSQRMSATLAELEPTASEALRLAVHAQHLCRWRIPRDAYPMDRAGYKAWRAALMQLHAELAGDVLREVGYDEALSARVAELLTKKRLKLDDEAQTLEDVACLVFLRFEWSAFAAKHDDEKLVRILARTWLKMSPRGQSAAARLELDDRARTLLARALASA